MIVDFSQPAAKDLDFLRKIAFSRWNREGYFSLDTGGGLRLRRRIQRGGKLFLRVSFLSYRRRKSGRARMEESCMDNFTFGITMLICGMGGTILTLWIMSLVMGLLGRLFPEKPEKKEA
jgi:hypothetical protein